MDQGNYGARVVKHPEQNVTIPAIRILQALMQQIRAGGGRGIRPRASGLHSLLYGQTFLVIITRTFTKHQTVCPLWTHEQIEVAHGVKAVRAPAPVG